MLELLLCCYCGYVCFGVKFNNRIPLEFWQKDSRGVERVDCSIKMQFNFNCNSRDIFKGLLQNISDKLIFMIYNIFNQNFSLKATEGRLIHIAMSKNKPNANGP